MSNDSTMIGRLYLVFTLSLLASCGFWPLFLPRSTAPNARTQDTRTHAQQISRTHARIHCTFSELTHSAFTQGL
eukprot:3310337-Rhodomonas_salina.1